MLSSLIEGNRFKFALVDGDANYELQMSPDKGTDVLQIGHN